MRNRTTTPAGLMALTALLAAATALPAIAADRTVVIRLPGEPVTRPGSGTEAESQATQNFYRLAGAAGSQQTGSIIGEAIKRLPKGSPFVSPGQVQLYYSDLTQSLASGELDVQVRVVPWSALGQDEAWAGQFADMLADVIRDRVGREWDAAVGEYKEALPKQKRDAAAAADRMAKARDRVAADEAKLRTETGRIDLAEAGMRAAQDALELEREKMELDLAGLRARQAALQDAIAQQAAKAEAAQKDDVALQALTKGVEVAKAHLQLVRQQYKSGVATMAEANAAELAELDAEARLAERRGAAGGSAEAMAQWNRELTDATVEQREKEARLDAAAKRLESLLDAAALRKDLDATRSAAAQAAKDVEKADASVRETADWLGRYGDLKPTFEVKAAGAVAAPATAPAPVPAREAR